MRKAILTLVIVLTFSSTAFAESIDWTLKEVKNYVVLTFDAFLNNNVFSGHEDAAVKMTCHMAAALQILKNKGIIYAFDVVLLKSEPDNVRFNVRVRMDVDSKVETFKFSMDATPKPKVVPSRQL